MIVKTWMGVAAIIGVTSARDDLHLAAQHHLQIPPSFAGNKIALYPAHRPGHEASSLDHLTPPTTHLLYYSQEGHRGEYFFPPVLILENTFCSPLRGYQI